jgi:hypothetical protein
VCAHEPAIVRALWSHTKDRWSPNHYNRSAVLAADRRRWDKIRAAERNQIQLIGET